MCLWNKRTTRVPKCALLLVLGKRAHELDRMAFGSDTVGRSHMVHIQALASHLLPPGL